MKLATLLGPEITAVGGSNPDITGLTADSRKVEPGMVFAALAGSKADGATFVADAVAKGAVAVLIDQATAIEVAPNVAVLRATDPRHALALMAARYHPRQPATIVAVTGTAGKTSVAEFARQIFQACGFQAASLGTLGLISPAGADYGSLTTPDPISLHRTLDRLAADGVTHLAMEASSHGLDQHRLDGVRLAAGAFTNLGHDHLDYHATMQAYLDAKTRLFKDLVPRDGAAVLFVDDGTALRVGGPPSTVAKVVAASGQRLVTVGVGSGDIDADRSPQARFPQAVEVTYLGQRYVTELPLIGTYQRDNALVAAGLAIAVGCDPATVFAAFRTLKGVPGRLELVGMARGAPVLVDYAHKPDALDRVLRELGQQVTTPGRLICVFGCGGDRDKGKRPMMGRIAAERAGVVIITDDNPRSEDAATIRAEVRAAAPGAIEIGDRREAIRHAIGLARTGDIVVIAGKGHERGQIVGTTVLPFSDHDEVSAALAEIEG